MKQVRIRNTGSIDHYLGYTGANVVHAAKLLLLAMLLEYPTNVTAVADVELNIVAIGSILHDTHTTVLLVYHSGHSTLQCIHRIIQLFVTAYSTVYSLDTAKTTSSFYSWP
jgi:hypothetical protein